MFMTIKNNALEVLTRLKLTLNFDSPIDKNIKIDLSDFHPEDNLIKNKEKNI